MAELDKIPEMEDDLRIIGPMSTYPAEDGLTEQGFRDRFDVAGLKLKDHLNKVIRFVNDKLGTASNFLTGGTMLGPINMNGQAISGLNAPVGDTEPVTKGYAEENFASKQFVEEYAAPPKAGFIYPLAASVIPDGFLLCDGAAYSRTEYPELFAAIGTMYGEGDGSTTFNVPDLVERVPAGAGDNHPAGQMVGDENHTLTVDEMPAHSHQGILITGIGMRWNASYATGNSYGVDTGESGNNGDFYTASAGGSQPHNIMQPTTYIRGYIIATGKGSGVSVSDIVTGVQALPMEVQYGGTGAANAVDARKNLGLGAVNLTDNSDFLHFVAQAGIGGKHGTQAYAGDRWILDSGTVTGDANPNGDGYSNIQLNGTIRQIIADPPEVGTVFVEMVSGTATAVYADGEVTVTSTGGVIKNVALYAGVYTDANKPAYQPKGYGAELAECQRYYYQTSGVLNTVNGIATVYFPVTMRITPTINVSSWAGFAVEVQYQRQQHFVVTGFNNSTDAVGFDYTASADL